jgi:glycosyltransferase involved in cell wall biosynthesis
MSAEQRSRSALVYGDVNLNLIDGSAIWVQSVVLALARAGCAVTLVLKAPVQTGRLLTPLEGEPGVTIRRPAEERLLEGIAPNGLTPKQASQVLSAVDAQSRHDLVVLRGRRLVSQVVTDGDFRGRLWTYLTDIPQSIPEMTPESVNWLTSVADSSRYVLCQTEELRCFLEGSVPAACGKCVLFPPVVPPVPEVTGTPAEPANGELSVLRLVYTGKFAPRWNTLEMTQLPGLLAERGVRAELHMVGDKIHNDPDDPGYQRRMRAALGEPPAPDVGSGGTADAPPVVPANGVVWRGGHSREGAMQIAAAADIGLGWRHPSLDASLELSTKVLEFGLLGLPVILNRTPMHEALLGADYPMFARDLDDVVAIAESVAADPSIMKLAASRTSAAAAEYTLDKASARIRRYLDDALPRIEAAPGTKTLKVAVAGHDLKFFTPLLDYLRQQPGLEVRTDHWISLGEHDEQASREIANWADVVICEWCGPNAIWYSENKRKGSRLIVRLHRFEVFARYPYAVKIRAVDQVVCVDKYYAQLTAEKTGWPSKKIVALPNTVEVGQLDRPKLDGARFNLGIVGIVPSRKRLDLALDVLEELRRDDERYMLCVKSGMPWDHWWIWQKPEERGHYAAALHRIQRSPLLRGAVVFDEAGRDVPAWLRRVGFVLSTSDDESFHVAPVEGMVSGAVPVIRHWPGAETVYDTRWIHETPAGMAAAIAGLRTEEQWREAGQLAKTQAIEAFESRKVFATWYRLLTENLPPAASVARYSLPGMP